MAALSAADSPDALKAAATLADRLTDDGDKKEARQRYREKLNALKSAKANDLTFAHVAEKINAAVNEDALSEAADLIQHVADVGQRDELGAMYKQRAEELSQ